jgi:hypothetical protein
MGSTVILLLAPGAGAWNKDLADHSTLRVGQTVGNLEPAR